VNKRRDCEGRFRERYAQPTTEAALIVERDAIGANVSTKGSRRCGRLTCWPTAWVWAPRSGC